MKLTYTRKVAFNINGTTICSRLEIPLKKIYNDEKCYTLIKMYDQLQIIIINEISLVGNRMLSFIAHKLRVIKQVHKELMSGLDVIIIDDFIKLLQFKIYGFSNQNMANLIFLESIFGMKT